MQRDMYNNVKVVGFVRVLVATAGNATAYSNSVDIGENRSASIFLSARDIDNYGATPYTLDQYDDVSIVVQDSEDNANFTDLDPVEKQYGAKTLEASSDKVGFFATRRYVRLKVVGNNLETLANNKLELSGVAVAEPYARPV